jgi:hypothetical protein
VEITKVKVLEVFMGHYNRLSELPDRERLMGADDATRDAFAPWREGMSPEEKTRLDLVTGFLDEILTEDFGLQKGQTTALTQKQVEISKVAFAAAKEFLAHSAHLVPPFPLETGDVGEWEKKAQAMAFEAVPKDRLADKEWTGTFIEAFAGALFMDQRDRH